MIVQVYFDNSQMFQKHFKGDYKCGFMKCHLKSNQCFSQDLLTQVQQFICLVVQVNSCVTDGSWSRVRSFRERGRNSL